MEKNMRLIDANTLKWKVGQVALYVSWLRFGKTALTMVLEAYRKSVFEEIDNAPTVDAEPVKHGRWVQRVLTGKHGSATCSECNTTWDAQSNYCPNCGAKMDQE